MIVNRFKKSPLRIAAVTLLLFLQAITLSVFSYADSVTNTYDAKGQVTKADYGGGSAVAYTYDAAGNITGKTVNGPGALYSISGRVKTSTKAAMSGVKMTLKWAETGTTFTNSTGNFTFTGLANGSYTVKPSKTGYNFTPISKKVTVNGANVKNRDFTGTASAPPTIGTLTPSVLVSAPGIAKTFTAKYSDADGYANIKQTYFRVHTAANGIYLRYDRPTNKLYLYNDAGTATVGSCTPGDTKTLGNTQGSLNCAATTVAGSGNELTIKWKIKPKAAFASATKKNLFMYVRDMSGLKAGWTDKGDWTITAVGASTAATVDQDTKYVIFKYGQNEEAYSFIEETSLIRDIGETEDISLMASAQEIGIIIKRAEAVAPEGSFQVVQHTADGIRVLEYDFDNIGNLKITEGEDTYLTTFTVNGSGGIQVEGLRGQISPDGQVLVMVAENGTTREKAKLLIGIRADTGKSEMQGLYNYVEMRQEEGQFTASSGAIQLTEGQQPEGYLITTPDGKAAVSVDGEKQQMRIYIRQKVQ